MRHCQNMHSHTWMSAALFSRRGIAINRNIKGRSITRSSCGTPLLLKIRLSIPDIYQVWENEGWPMPVVEESYNPDRTRLSLEFAKKQTIKTSEEEKEPKRSQKGAEKEPIKGAERKKEILKLIKVNSTITQVEIMKELDLTRKQVQKDMKELQEMHIIAREGTNRRGRWIIVKENK